MPSISLIKDPLSGESEIYSTENVNLMAWIARELPWIGGAGAVIVLNGNIIADSTRHTDMAELCSVELSGDDAVQIYAKPEGIDPLTAAIIIVAAVAISFVLIPKPKIPNNAGETSSSPNNQLNAATNEFRPRQAMPDLSGRLIAYPDFIQSPSYEYINNIKTFNEWFCLGIGWHEIHGIFTEKQNFNDIAGNSYTVYNPDAGALILRDVRSTNEVDGQELVAPDDPSVEANVTGAEITTDSVDTTLQISEATSNQLQLSVGDILRLDGEVIVIEVGTLPYFLEAEILTINTVGGVTTITMPGTDGEGSFSGTITKITAPEDVTWYVVPGSQNTEIWFQIFMPQGIRGSGGSLLDLNIDCIVQQIDAAGVDIGTPITETLTITGNTLQAQGRTYKKSGLTAGRYKARAVRRTPKQDETGVDSVKFEALQGVREYSKDFGNVTLINTLRRSTVGGTGSRQSKINVDCTRRLELFNPVDGTFADGVFTATRSCAQYVMYLLRKKANVKLSYINYQRLFNLEPAGELGFFDFSFDDKNVGLRDRLETVLNVARMKYYNIGNRFDFVRDEPRAVRQAFFNRRNISGELELSRVGVRTNDFDSVSVRYVDPDSNEERFVHRRINPATGAIETGEGDRPDKLDLAGCRSLANATNRAELEIRRKKYIQWSGKCNALGDALTIGPLDRIGVADINDSETFDGEIISIEGGGLYRTSEPFEPAVGVSYVIEMTGQDGLMGAAVPVTAHPSTKFGFSAPALAGAYVSDGYAVSMGARYLISSDSTFASTDFSLVKRGRPTGSPARVPIEFVQYDARIYEMD